MLEKIKSLILASFPDIFLEERENSTPEGLTILPKDLLRVCELLQENEATYFDMLSCVTGIDHGVEKNTMEVVYHLYSIPYDYSLALSVVLSRETPEVASLTEIWKAANWHEREAYDLLGIRFMNHPDLRRILMPDDWEGYPLRKDYETQETYHEIKVKY